MIMMTQTISSSNQTWGEREGRWQTGKVMAATLVARQKDGDGDGDVDDGDDDGDDGDGDHGDHGDWEMAATLVHLFFSFKTILLLCQNVQTQNIKKKCHNVLQSMKIKLWKILELE